MANILEVLAPQKSVVVITTLLGYDDDNQPIHGDEQEIEAVPLTWHEWEEIGARLENPPVPTVKQGRVHKPVPDDPGYVQTCRELDRLRDAMRVTKALLNAGHDIPGSTLEEQGRALMQGISTGAANALVSFLRTAAFGTGARTRGDADSFRGVPENNGTDMPPDGLDADDVVELAG